MKAALAELGRSPWSAEQLRSLRAAFRVLVNALDRAILMRGSVREEMPIRMDSLPLPMDIPFAAKPAAVIVLSATKVTDGSTISSPPILWTWTPSSSRSTVTITDIDLDAGEDYTMTVLFVESVA